MTLQRTGGLGVAMALVLGVAGLSGYSRQAETSSAPAALPEAPAARPVRPAAPAPPAVASVPAADSAALLARGEELYTALVGAYDRNSSLTVWGAGTPSAKASVSVPLVVWEGYSEEDRNALRAFVRAQIPLIRARPGAYLDIPTSAPAYPLLERNVRNMSDTAVVIFTLVQSGGQWIQDKTVYESR